jgi:hypothetical protein
MIFRSPGSDVQGSGLVTAAAVNCGKSGEPAVEERFEAMAIRVALSHFREMIAIRGSMGHFTSEFTLFTILVPVWYNPVYMGLCGILR